MGKRLAEYKTDNDTKRRKIEEKPKEAPVEKIHGARQLQQVLTFHQDAVPQLRAGIKSFKAFLESILYPQEGATTFEQQSLLKQFLDSQASYDDSDAEPTYLPSLIQAWSFATHANNEALLSSIPAILALLLRTISSLIEFREHGLAIAKTCLKQEPLQELYRGLSSATTKEHLISPCLRLLTEVVSFDGGSLAKRVYRSRSFTFDTKIVSRNLTLWKQSSDDKALDRRQPSVRSNTVRYVITHLKFQASATRAELLKYSNVLGAVFRYAKHDPPELLRDTFKAFKDVLQDADVPRQSKSYAFVDHNLIAIAGIYHSESAKEELQGNGNDKLAHHFLSFICSNITAGVLRHSSWYPPGTDKIEYEPEFERKSGTIDLGLDSIEWYGKYQSNVPIRNVALANLAQFLRPYSSILESELLVTIFKFAPELVADYFFKKTNFTFDPKLTSTWMGYSAFLFSTLQIPVPKYFGRGDDYWSVPPPTTIILENILPQPLSQKVLTRCLNQKQDLVVFIAIRILISAFEKFKSCTSQMRAAAMEQGGLWEEGLRRLVNDFSMRCPKMKDVISAFQKVSDESTLQKEAILKLLQLYYEVLPQDALDERFDIGGSLIKSMRRLELGKEQRNEDINVQLVELNHLLQISLSMPDMKWWQKPENLKLSPFSTLLQITVTVPQQKLPKEMRSLLHSVATEYGISQDYTKISSLNALMASLSSSSFWSPSQELFEFLDEVFTRLVRRPIKYQDDLDQMQDSDDKHEAVSLVLVTVLEQWPHFATKEQSENIAQWINRFLTSLELIGEDKAVLSQAKKSLADVESKHRETIAQTRKVQTREIQSELDRTVMLDTHQPAQDISTSSTTPQLPIIDPNLYTPEPEDAEASGLHRWSEKPISEAIIDGDVSALVICLSSQYFEVRTQAYRNLQQIMQTLDAAPVKTSFPPSRQIWLLLGILTNTVAPLVKSNDDSDDEETTKVPYLLTAYASTAVLILTNPLHPMYTKIASFHTKGPTINIKHLPSYWTHQLLFSPPTDQISSSSSNPSKATTQIAPSLTHPANFPQANSYPNTRHTEIAFFVTYLYASLRSTGDLEILRQRGTLEPLLALASNDVYLPSEIRESILALLWRVTALDGGSTMLITRCGGITALGGMIANAREEKVRRAIDSSKAGGRDGEPARQTPPRLSSREGLKMLVHRVWETCDGEHVGQWSGGTMGSTVDKILKT